MPLTILARRYAQLPRARRRAYLERLRAEGLSFDMLPILPRDGSEPVPLAGAQRALWLAWQRAPQSPAYNLAGSLAIRGECSPERVHGCLEDLVRRHAILRTHYGWGSAGEPNQRIDPEARFGWECHRWEAGREPGAEALAAAAALHAAQPFDLERGPLLRAALQVCGDATSTLFVVVHHMAADGGSVELLLAELMAALRGDTELSREPPSLQYADYALWQQRWLEAGELDRQLAFWRERLRGAPAVTNLPLDRPRLAERRADGLSRSFRLAPHTAAALAGLGARHGASPYMCTLALLGLLLHRQGGDAEVCIGMPSANRNRAELATMVGHFTNVLVLRIRCDAEDDFDGLLRQVRGRVLDAGQHPDVPLDQLIETLAVERQPGTHPLFQVKCAQQIVQPAPAPAPAPAPHGAGSVQVQAHAVAVDAVHFDLSLDLVEVRSGSTATFSYALSWARDLFDAATVERLITSFQSLADQVTSAPGRRLALTTLPGPVSVLQGEPGDGPAPDVVSRFVAMAARYPRAHALLEGDRAYSHAALEQASSACAARLARLGLGPEDRVAVHGGRSAAFVLALLAVLKAGATFVPLDPGLPPERLDAVLDDCGARWVLAAEPLSWTPTVPVLAVSFDEHARPTAADFAPFEAWPAQLAAYVIYTSGSTGKPKGVVVSRGALGHYVQGLSMRTGWPAGLNFAWVSTVAADLGHSALFGALCSGGCVVLFDAVQAFDPEACALRMSRHAVDVLKIAPSHLRALLQASRPRDVLPRRALILGGEAADPSLLDLIRDTHPSLRIYNHYGPTETTVGMLMHALPPAQPGQRDAMPLGLPIPDVSACVLDARLRAVQAGAPGELHIGGPGVARGYLGQPGLTASRFVASPFAAGERLYRSGDRVRQRGVEGPLEFLGRVDDQVKIRGFRVEPGELRSRMLQLAGIADAAVVAVADAEGGHRLRAYAVPRAGSAAEPERWRAELQRGLPAYLVPDTLHVLPALPLNANGKLDRKALPSPAPDPLRDPGAAPRGAAEIALARIWCEVLGIEQVGRDDDFYALGGDSIQSLKAIARIRKQVPGGADLALSDVMQATRLQDLAARVAQRLARRHDAVCLEPSGDAAPLFCLPGLIVNSREFMPLAAALRGKRPVYGFVSHVYTQQRWRGFDIEALAREYAEFILGTAPQGRCALLGWSSGGDLAFEVARRLEGRLAIECLALVDVFHTEPLRATRPLGRSARARADAKIDAWLLHSEMALRWRELLARMDEVERDALAEQVLAPDFVLPLDGSGDEAAETLLWATLDKRVRGARHRPGRIATPVHVYQARSSQAGPGALRAWGENAPVASLTIVPEASHLNIVRDPQWLADMVCRLG